jgi:hypothetical protein
LDVVGWQRAVVKGLEEEFDVLEEVGVGIEDSVADIGSVHHGNNIGEELELVQGWLALLTCLIIFLAGSVHHLIESNELVVNFVLKILKA